MEGLGSTVGVGIGPTVGVAGDGDVVPGDGAVRASWPHAAARTDAERRPATSFIQPKAYL